MKFYIEKRGGFAAFFYFVLDFKKIVLERTVLFVALQSARGNF